jgi:aerobic-type carbon monoxide dehydrogenase small subunit (CoxS/CutS family)
MNKELIQLRVNGRTEELAAEPNRTLLDVLREDLRLTGTKCGCDDSSCGACTVLVDGQPMLACTMLAASAQEADIYTIEGLATAGELDALQRGFVAQGGAQCGFCTPAMILTLRALLTSDGHPCPSLPSDEEIREAIAGNICRCTGYMQICESVKHAVHELREGLEMSRDGHAGPSEPGVTPITAGRRKGTSLRGGGSRAA